MEADAELEAKSVRNMLESIREIEACAARIESLVESIDANLGRYADGLISLPPSIPKSPLRDLDATTRAVMRLRIPLWIIAGLLLILIAK